MQNYTQQSLPNWLLTGKHTYRHSIISQMDAEGVHTDANQGSFPPEIVDYIIDFLTTDISSLKSCSVVCQAWSPRARFHLLKILYLTSSHRVRGYMRSLLRSQVIGRYVEQLTVRPSSPEDCRDFECIADYLGSVKDLTLDMRAYWIAPEIIAKLGPITRLRIQNTVFGEFLHFRAILAAVPNVAHLILDTVSCISRSSIVPLDLELPLRSLWLYNFDHLYDALLRPMPTMLELRLSIKLAKDLPALRSALARVGPHVESLEVGFVGTDHPWFVTQIADALSECAALTSLALYFEELIDASWVTFPFIEARNSSPNLKWVTVGLNPKIDDRESKIRAIQQRLQTEAFDAQGDVTGGRAM
ncbi:hypothetical protein CERSUDRAFT_77171 [Gelatoporia subvermispora B]|uniref:F-box domain-containing protein n=1 Tax=Ceriporiopsis subvermispora (strain B) TaxID=914234 RepID=M2Q7H6_CERS8|nr:hypothetical protein CERSUDRAFT_77171 [Gelatoporia subvermispora B]